MPRLILLNGPPGCGKSTLAQMYVEEHPLALNLDIDVLRRLIGQWRREAPASGLLARAITLSAARTHLAAGHDVVIPQYLGRLEFIEQAERLAGEVGAAFREVVLLDSAQNAIRRFLDRGLATTDPTHVEMQQIVDENGGVGALAEMYDRLLAVVASRPAARVVHTTSGQIAQAYRDFMRSLA